MCFGCSKEPSHWDGSFEYPQHMFWVRNKENNFPIRTLIWRPVPTKRPNFLDPRMGWLTVTQQELLTASSKLLARFLPNFEP